MPAGSATGDWVLPASRPSPAGVEAVAEARTEADPVRPPAKWPAKWVTTNTKLRETRDRRAHRRLPPRHRALVHLELPGPFR